MPQVRPTLMLLSALALAACQPETPAPQPQQPEPEPQAQAAPATPPAPLEHSLVALPGHEADAPALTTKQTIVMHTDAGDLTIEVYPEAAPNAVARFVELVNTGFYDNTPVSRVVPGFVAQFGINWRDQYKSWQSNHFDDDPTRFALERGTLAFAKAGPNTNSTQVFINYTENNRLADPQYNFTVFGKVVDGMEVVDSFVQVGDPSGGLDQGQLWENGDAYLQGLDVKPTMILTARVQ